MFTVWEYIVIVYSIRNTLLCLQCWEYIVIVYSVGNTLLCLQ